jgi:hypothetical protein
MLGRSASGLARRPSAPRLRAELVFDPHTYALLAENSVVVRPDPAYHVKPGSVHTGSTYVSFGIVKRIGQVPGR